MRHRHLGTCREQANVLPRQYLQDGGLPFTDVLTTKVITDALAAVGGCLRVGLLCSTSLYPFSENAQSGLRGRSPSRKPGDGRMRSLSSRAGRPRPARIEESDMSRVAVGRPPDHSFDLPAIFGATVEYGRAIAGSGADVAAEYLARGRLLDALNPRRRWFGSDSQFALNRAYPGSSSRATNNPRYFDEVDFSPSLPFADARTALKTIAVAVVLLSGEGEHRDRGRELLGSGAWLLWQGMSGVDRDLVRPLLPEAVRMWVWEAGADGEPGQHRGPTRAEICGMGSIDLGQWRLLPPGELWDRLTQINSRASDLNLHGQLVFDLVHDGNDWVEITGLSCKVIRGARPTACPDANPAVPPTLLPAIAEAVRRRVGLPEGLTIHWVGHDTGYRGRCRCHPDAPTAAPCDRERWAELGHAGSTNAPAVSIPSSGICGQDCDVIPGHAENAMPAEISSPPDGLFGADGFRFGGEEVHFGRAALQRRLVLALWDAETHRPRPARPVVDVLDEVYGDGHKKTDATFRQLCADTNSRFEKENLPLRVQNLQAMAQLVPRPS